MLLFEEKAFHSCEVIDGVVDFLKLLLDRAHQINLDLGGMLYYLVKHLRIVVLAFRCALFADAFVADVTVPSVELELVLRTIQVRDADAGERRAKLGLQLLLVVIGDVRHQFVILVVLTLALRAEDQVAASEALEGGDLRILG